MSDDGIFCVIFVSFVIFPIIFLHIVDLLVVINHIIHIQYETLNLYFIVGTNYQMLTRSNRFNLLCLLPIAVTVSMLTLAYTASA